MNDGTDGDGIAALVSGIEGLFGNKSGDEKKDAAMTFIQNALGAADAIAEREIVNPEEFLSGISLIIDGTVKCLNSSAWAKNKTLTASGS